MVDDTWVAQLVNTSRPSKNTLGYEPLEDTAVALGHLGSHETPSHGSGLWFQGASVP